MIVNCYFSTLSTLNGNFYFSFMWYVIISSIHKYLKVWLWTLRDLMSITGNHARSHDSGNCCDHYLVFFIYSVKMLTFFSVDFVLSLFFCISYTCETFQYRYVSRVFPFYNSYSPCQLVLPSVVLYHNAKITCISINHYWLQIYH